MKKNKFVVSTIILTIGGLLTKILNMIIKITVTRIISNEGIGLYSLINPTFLLFISICTLGLPTAISKLISENNKNNKNLIFSSIFIITLLNILLLLFILLTSKYISINLLHESRLYYSIISIGLVLPFISISSILRGYFFGKQKMFPHVLSNFLEDIVRLIFLIIFLPKIINKGIEYGIAFLILSNIISEITSIIILTLFLPKNIKIYKKDIIPSNIKNILNIGLPTTGSRLIGTIGYFLEPILITKFLLLNNYPNNYILTEYGIINGYVMPLVLLPSFFTTAISQALLPIVSNNYVKKNYKYIKKKIKQSILFSLLIGIPATLIFIFIPNIPLKIIFNTNNGLNYIKILAPICLLYYIQAPLTSTLQGINQSKQAMYDTLIGMILRTISLIIFSKLGIYNLIIASSINIIYVTLLHYLRIKKTFKFF